MSVLRNEVRAGVLVLLAVGVLTVGMLALAGSGSLFEDTKSVVAILANARGLREGDPVRFAGLKVGTVDRLEIRAGASDTPTRIAASLTVPGDLAIPADSRITVTESLTGSRIVEIIPGTAAPLEEGAHLENLQQPVGFDDLAYSAKDLVNAAEKTIAAAGDLVDRAGSVVDGIKDDLGDGQVEEILGALQGSAKDIAKAAQEVRDMLEENRPGIKETVDSFSKMGAEASALMEETRPELKEILARVKVAADGVARLFEGPDAPVPGVVARIDEAAAKLTEVLDGFSDTGREASNLIASSRPRVEGILDRLKRTATNLEAVSEDLRSHPWKIMNTPDEVDQRVQTLFNAARNFNSGAESLGEATRELKSMLGRDGANSAEIRKLLERLDRSFERYERVESLFWEALRDGKK